MSSSEEVKKWIFDYYEVRLPEFETPSRRFHILNAEPTLDWWHVPGDSKSMLRELVAQCAVYLQREKKYDFCPYSAERISEKDSAYLLGFSPDVDVNFAVGALEFRWMEWNGYEASYSLEWVWVHPFFRGQGVLKKIWPHFESAYGKFHVSYPRSGAMVAFLASMKFEERFPQS